jgi:hypothetical protein
MGVANAGSNIYFIDAKQRAVYSVLKNDQIVTCAEPSPDALSALAASQGLGVSNGTNLSVNEAMSISEAAGSIGLRTQSIQLMRDAMFRICEGYVSGALSKGSFETLHRRLQSSMVAILAIEQLTGAVKAQQIVLGGGASTGAAEQIEKLTQATADAQTTFDSADTDSKKAAEELAARKKTLDAAQAAATAAPDDSAKQTALADAQTKYDEQKKASDAADDKTAKSKSAYEAIDAGRKAALSGMTNANSTGQIGAISGGQLSDGAAQSVSEAVQNIVSSALDLQFSNEFCTTILVADTYKDIAPSSPAAAKCIEILNETKLRISSETTYQNLVNMYYISHPNAKPSDDIPQDVESTPKKPKPTPPLKKVKNTTHPLQKKKIVILTPPLTR